MQQAGSNNHILQNLTLEICVDSVQSAISAERGGAHRLELCNSLSEGGTTPSAGMIEMVKKNTSLDLHILIRPRRGDFLYSALEFEIIKRDIKAAKDLGANGVVIGILKEDGQIDLERMQELVELSRPLSITFHRAFDLCADPFKALDDLIKLKVHRLLTSGQQPTAYQGMSLIAELVKKAHKQLIVMPGGGINLQNIQEIRQKTAALEFHTTARKKVISKMDFRRNEVPMAGVQQLSEYENLVADSDQISAMRKAIKQ